MINTVSNTKCCFRHLQDQAVFQNLVSNEGLSLAIKNKAAFEGVIYAHGIMAGNLLPAKWTDNGGSLRRRKIMINFMRRVGKTKPDLIDKLRGDELPAIIRKINYCYRHAVSIVGSSDLWSSGLLSTFMTEENAKLFESMNSLRSFIFNSEIVLQEKGSDDILWIPEVAFQTHFNSWLKSNSKPSQQWTPDFFDSVFSELNITVRKASYVWDSNARVTGNVVLGCIWESDRMKRNVVEGSDNPSMEQSTSDRGDLMFVSQEDYERD